MKLLRSWLNGLLLAVALVLGLCASTTPSLAQFWWSSPTSPASPVALANPAVAQKIVVQGATRGDENTCLLYTSDAADE